MRRAACAAVLLLSSYPTSSAFAQQFAHEAPGDLLPGSGIGLGGDTVYAPEIIFPIELGGYANSQVYNPGGQFGPPGGQCDPSNYAYPWRDNFCETRSHSAALCPAHTGHLGQDIRPPTCHKDLYWAVAVTDGIITGKGSYVLDLTAPDGTTYSYLHMSGVQLAVGQSVVQGQRLGKVSNQFGGASTTWHLHFEIEQNLEGIGVVEVPPYPSLIEAFEDSCAPAFNCDDTLASRTRRLACTGRCIEPSCGPGTSKAIFERFRKLPEPGQTGYKFDRGYPFDNGGGPGVHQWAGIWLQDFAPSLACPTDQQPAYAIIANDSNAYVVRAGFWGAYKCLLGSAGPTILGPPTGEEKPITVEGAFEGARQDFVGGYMWWGPGSNCPSSEPCVHVHATGLNLQIQLAASCADLVVVNNEPGPGGCVSTCQVGDQVCTGSTTRSFCGAGFGGNPCYTMSPDMNCVGGNVCEDGECVPPGVEQEACNGDDDDWDGYIDEGDPEGGAFCSTGLPGVCGAGVRHCILGNLECVQTTNASAETCGNVVDDDCDGFSDEECGDCTPGEIKSCYGGAISSLGIGPCKAGTEQCWFGGVWSGVCSNQVLPEAEECDAVDNDCNAKVDDTFDDSAAVDAAGDPATGFVRLVYKAPACAEELEVMGEVDDPSGTIQENFWPPNTICMSLLTNAITCDLPVDAMAGGSIWGNVELTVAGQKHWACEEIAGEFKWYGSVVAKWNGSTLAPTATPHGTEGCNFTFDLPSTCVPTMEMCDGLDNDCDIVVDDGNPEGGGDCMTAEPGACAPGKYVCDSTTGGNLVCEPIAMPAAEECNNLDDDCDGLKDEGCGLCLPAILSGDYAACVEPSGRLLMRISSLSNQGVAIPEDEFKSGVWTFPAWFTTPPEGYPATWYILPTMHWLQNDVAYVDFGTLEPELPGGLCPFILPPHRHPLRIGAPLKGTNINGPYAWMPTDAMDYQAGLMDLLPDHTGATLAYETMSIARDGISGEWYPSASEAADDMYGVQAECSP